MEHICVEMAGMGVQDSYLIGQGKLLPESEMEVSVNATKENHKAVWHSAAYTQPGKQNRDCRLLGVPTIQHIQGQQTSPAPQPTHQNKISLQNLPNSMLSPKIQLNTTLCKHECFPLK